LDRAWNSQGGTPSKLLTEPVSRFGNLSNMDKYPRIVTIH